MEINLADIIVVVIVIFGFVGLFRGARSVALTLAAIFFAIVVVLLSAGLVIEGLGRLGVPLIGSDTQSLFTAALFLFTVTIATLVLRRVVAVPRRDLSRSEKIWGLLLGLLNGFLIMAVVEHYLAAALQATGGVTLVGLPALRLDHPASNTWSISIVSTPFTILPGGASADLWSKLPIALILLLLFLAFVFVGTLYGRMSRSGGGVRR